MTVIELRDQLNKLIEQTPNTENDEIYFYDTDSCSCDVYNLNKVSIEFDLNQIGRYIVIK